MGGVAKSRWGAASGRVERGGHRWRRGRRSQVASRVAVTGGVEGGEAAGADGEWAAGVEVACGGDRGGGVR